MGHPELEKLTGLNVQQKTWRLLKNLESGLMIWNRQSNEPSLGQMTNLAM